MSKARHSAVPMAVVLLMIACASPVAPDAVSAAGASAPATATASSVASAVLSLTNAARGRTGLAPLRLQAPLVHAAQLQAEQLVEAGRLDHVLSGAQYATPADRLAAAGYAWQAYAENIAWGQPGAPEVMSSWMKSSGHRSNILNGKYTELGVGYSMDAAGRPYYVQVFGRPAS